MNGGNLPNWEIIDHQLEVQDENATKKRVLARKVQVAYVARPWQLRNGGLQKRR